MGHLFDYRKWFLFGIGLLICYALYRTADIEADLIVEKLISVSLFMMIVFFLVELLYQVVRGVRWRMITSLIYPGLKYRRGFFVTHQMMSLSTFVLSAAGAGTAVRAVAQKMEGGVSLKGLSSIFIIEHLFAVLFLLMMSVGAWTYYFDITGKVPSLVLLVGMGIVFWKLISCCLFHMARLIGETLIRVLGLFGRTNDWVSVFIEKIGGLHNRGLGGIVLFTVLAYLVPVIYYVILMEALDIGFRVGELFIYFPVVYLASYVSFTPFGLGIREVGNAGLVLLIGGTNEEALLFAAAIRVFGDLANVLMALLGYFAWQQIRNGREG